MPNKPLPAEISLYPCLYFGNTVNIIVVLTGFILLLFVALFSAYRAGPGLGEFFEAGNAEFVKDMGAGEDYTGLSSKKLLTDRAVALVFFALFGFLFDLCPLVVVEGGCWLLD